MTNEASQKRASSRQTPLELHRYICVGVKHRTQLSVSKTRVGRQRIGTAKTHEIIDSTRPTTTKIRRESVIEMMHS
jgi:hypothetical protein